MTLFIKTTALSIVLLSAGSDAFAPATRFGVPTTHSTFRTTRSLYTPLRVASVDQEQQTADNEVDRLKSMAFKLRAEAAALEAEQANEMAQAAEKAFKKFDSNNDGEISLEELKAGLEKAFKIDVPETQVQNLMENFDTSGDGALQLEEFVGIDKIRNQLDQLNRQEKETGREAAKIEQQEAEAAKQAEARLAVINETINEKEPTNTEKVLSVLPYLLPLLDGLPFGRFLLESHQDNPVVLGLAALFALYRLVPLGGFIAYGALSTLGENLAINKLIRFNMKQAIYLDIALFFPGIIAALGALIAGGGGGFQLPQGLGELGQDAAFVTLLLVIGYSTVSSLLGATPDKIPFISDAVTQRVPSIDMFDEQGQFIQKEPEEKDDKKSD